MKKFSFVLLLIISATLVESWEKYDGNPVLSPDYPWCFYALGDPDLIAIPGGGFYLVYTAAGLDSVHGTVLTRPGAAWSSNGFDWTMSSGPVLTNGDSGTWDSAAVETPAVVFDNDSIILVYVGDWAHGAWQEMGLGIASSHDGGETFTRLTDGPVLENDTTRPEELYWVESPTILRIGDSLIMWYNSLTWDTNGQIVVCRASSFDGINWNRHSENPVMSNGQPGQFDEAGVYSPCVRQSRDSLIMIYQGFMWNHICDTCWLNLDTCYMGCASSTDKGISWNRCPDNPVLGPGPDSSWDSKGTATPTFCVNGNMLIIFYWNGGNYPTGGELGIATHTMEKVAERQVKPLDLSLSVSPNPFNSSCEIVLAGVTHASPLQTKIEIFDMNGRCVFETPYCPDGTGQSVPLNQGGQNSSPARVQGVIWRPDNSISSGIYLMRATAPDGQTAAKRVTYLK